MNPPPAIVLASASPRRAALLRQMGVPFVVRPAAVDEARLPGETPAALVRRLALAKAEAAPFALPVLAADTVVAAPGAPARIFGKPRDAAAFHAMMQALSAGTHTVFTAIALRAERRAKTEVVRAEVTLGPIDRRDAAAYWATGEPADKAGGYAIQGIGGIFVRSVRGSPSAVVGLPIAETEQLLRQFGIDTWRWRAASHRRTAADAAESPDHADLRRTGGDEL